MISRKPLRSLIGLLLYIPLVIVPVAVVVGLLWLLRDMRERGTRALNLILASCAVLLMLMNAGRWADLMNARLVAAMAVVLAWFAGAIGLFYRNRLAWIGSLIGAGTSVCFFAAVLVAAIVAYLYPDAAMKHNLELDRQMGGGGYTFAFVYAFTQFSLLLAISLRLLIGLWQMRKELCGRI